MHAEELNIAKEKRPLLGEVTERTFLEHVLEMSQEAGGHNGNLQARSLACYLGEKSEGIRELDIPRYVGQLHFVGLQEHFDLSIFLLHRLRGFPLLPTELVNDYRHGPRIEYLPEWFVRKCEAYFYLDFLLYRLAARRFDEQHEYVMQTFPQAAHEWREYQKNSCEVRRA